MSIALNAGVSGLQAHQTMLDVAGNNIANVNTTAYKTSSVAFSELYSQTIANASAPTSTSGGTNAQQIGIGVGVASISNNTTQGSISNSDNPLDCAIDGEGYFVVNDGSQNLYTRAGTFNIDENGSLVETSTGYLAQRINTTGEAEGFQTAGDSSIHLPYDTPIAQNATTSVAFKGNLSASDSLDSTQTQVISSNITLTTDGITPATSSTLLTALHQYDAGSGTALTSATITVSGYDPDGTALTDSSPLSVSATTTVGDLISHIQSVIGSSSTVATVSLSNGNIKITDANSGYSLTDIKLTFANSGTATLDMPAYFKYTTVGGDEVQNTSISVFDSDGIEYTMSGAFVRTDTANTWDFVLTSITSTDGEEPYNIDIADRRVSGLTFSASDGTYSGTSATEQFAVKFSSSLDAQTIALDFGDTGSFTGLTQVGGASTAVASDQDGYAQGNLSSIAVDSSGNLVGSFTNGIKKNIATLKLALFNNPAGLERAGSGLYTTSANSGTAKEVQANTSGSGKVKGGSLEQSNADLADQYVNLIQAQNGYQANARTIQVANDILKELTNLIR